jgi:hypothetical protein
LLLRVKIPGSGMVEELSTFQKKVAERKAAKQESKPSFDNDLIPDLGEFTNPRNNQLDTIINQLDIVDAYVRWCGKSKPDPRGKRESVMISCPNPSHPDKNPSAWMNLDKNTWFCGGCNIGGDIFDIAAWHFGYPVPGYKTATGEFVKLRQQMGEALGYVEQTAVGGQKYVEKIVDETEQPLATVSYTPEAVIAETEADEEPERAGVTYQTIDWRSLVTPGTFLAEWMERTSEDDLPEEYYFWLGLQALGLAVGRNAYLEDAIPVYGNMYICLLGKSGFGKSRSIFRLSQLLTGAVPYDFKNPGTTTGVQMVPSPGSAESLIDSFSAPVPDPANSKQTAYHAPVRALVKFDEMSTLIQRSGRVGSALKPTLMEFYDANAMVTLKTRGQGLTIAQEPFCSTISTTQVKSIRELITRQDADSGFLNRWIFVTGAPKANFDLMGIQIDLAYATQLLKDIHVWAKTPVPLRMDNGTPARKVWSDAFYNVIQPIKEADDSDLATRLDLIIKKLIVLLSVNEMSQPTEEIVKKACSLVEYLTGNYRILDRSIGHGQQIESEELVIARIKQWQEQYKVAPTARELSKSLKRKLPLQQVNKILEDLVKADIISTITVNQGKVGRPTIRFTYDRPAEG